MNTIDPIKADPSGSLVPAEHKQALQRKPKQYPEFPKWILEQIGEVRNRDKAGYRRRHRKWLTNWLFYNGEQYGFWDSEGSYHNVEPTQKRKFYICNYLSWFVDATQKEWARAKTELTVHPADDCAESEGAARIAANILAHYQRKLRTPIEHQEEGLTAACTGVYFRHTYYSLAADGGTGKWPRYEDKTVDTGTDAFTCGGCGNAGDAQELVSGWSGDQSCPDCGSNQINNIPSPQVNTSAVAGYDQLPLGDIVSENVDPFEIRVHPSARAGRISDSPYLLRERRILKCVLEDIYEWAEIPDADSRSTYEPGLRYQKVLERSAGSVSDGEQWGEGHYSRENDSDTVLFTEIWLDKPMYTRWQFDQDLTLGNGMTIPQGTPLGELFPNGLYVATVGDFLLDVRDESKNKHWVCGVYRLLPTSFWGRGIEDAVWQQKLLNDCYNLMIEYLKRCSAPTVVYNSLLIEPGTLSGIPGEAIPVEADGLQTNLDQVYRQISPTGMPPQISQFIEQSKKDMQSQIGAFSPLTGAPDMDVQTATGVKLLREASVALIAMALSIKAEVDALWGQQVLELAQENFVVPRVIPILGDYGRVENKWFSSIDISTHLVVSYAEHSVTPRSEVERRNDVIEAMAAGNVPLGIWNPQIPPELRRLLAERFNVPYAANRDAQSERLAKIRLDQITELAQEALGAATQFGEGFIQPGPPDPMTGQPGPIPAVMSILQQVPINPKMDNHDVHMSYIQDWFQKDEGIFASDLLKQVMEARYEQHLEAKVQVEQMLGAAQVQAQMPQMMAAQAAGQTMGGASQNLPATKAPKGPAGEELVPPAAPTG